jgi:hypothetical protein
VILLSWSTQTTVSIPAQEKTLIVPKAVLMDMDARQFRDFWSHRFHQQPARHAMPVHAAHQQLALYPVRPSGAAAGDWAGHPGATYLPSALATARFLQKQRQKSTAYVIGESGITTTIHEIGYIPTAHAEEAVMISDRMDTDMVADIESGLGTILVLTGVTTRDIVYYFSYRPKRIVNSIADLVGEFVELTTSLHIIK